MKLKTRYGIDKDNVDNIIKAIKENRLLCAINNNTTNRVCYCEWYIMENNDLDLIGVNSSGAIGMDRRFSCYVYGLLEEIEKHKPNSYSELSHIQNYKMVGNY